MYYGHAENSARHKTLATLDLLRVNSERALRLTDNHHFKLNQYFALFLRPIYFLSPPACGANATPADVV
jgi:hypothetical protein